MSLPHYERHRREYTLLGITSVIDAMLSEKFASFYGVAFAEFPAIIENGAYYHFQLAGDRQRVSSTFLERVNHGEIDLGVEYPAFDAAVAEYDEFMKEDPSTYTLKTILKFYDFYHKIIMVDYACMDSMDVIDVLRPELRPHYEELLNRIRHRGETVYKRGEMEFIPRFTKWMAENIVPEYTAEQLQYVIDSEMIAYINQGNQLPTPEELNERKKLCYMNQWPGNRVEIYTGDAAREAIRNKGLSLSDAKVSDVHEVKGVAAFHGNVSGKVCVVHTRADMAKFADGDIIVASMTDPSYLPIMKRATAFVTDEGGMLCHAAIVARELKKPCVIGTKIATDVFKDGDMVEVDAEKGIVKKIN